MAQKHKLTVNYIDKLPLESGTSQKLYWDSELVGFGLRVGSKSKTYIVQKEVEGKTTRTTIGRHGVFTTQQAREVATKVLGQFAQGINVNNERKAKKERGKTLADVYKQFRQLGLKRLRPRTISGYDDFIERGHLKIWANTPMNQITKDMVRRHYMAIGTNGAPGAAHNAMRLLNTLFNFAIVDNPSLNNPVAVMAQQKLWRKAVRKQTWLNERVLPLWFAALKEVSNDTIRDALLFLLFSGMRKNEALKLQWENVNLKHKSFCVPITKNKNPLWLPLNSELLVILEGRKHLSAQTPWVFAGTGIKSGGHLVEPARAIAQINKRMKELLAEEDPAEASRLPTYGLHDLRRTFITYAERLDFSSHALKRLVNHTIDKSDVTSGYISPDVERLRKPMQAIADEINSHLKK